MQNESNSQYDGYCSDNRCAFENSNVQRKYGAGDYRNNR